MNRETKIVLHSYWNHIALHKAFWCFFPGCCNKSHCDYRYFESVFWNCLLILSVCGVINYCTLKIRKLMLKKYEWSGHFQYITTCIKMNCKKAIFSYVLTFLFIFVVCAGWWAGNYLHFNIACMEWCNTNAYLYLLDKNPWSKRF